MDFKGETKPQKSQTKTIYRPKKVYTPSGTLLTSNYYIRDASGNIMAIYKANIDTTAATIVYTVNERNIYGSDRLGIYTYPDTVYPPPPTSTADFLPVWRGFRKYELKNHLGNVMAVVNGNKIPLDENNDSLIDGFTAQIEAAYDYSPFGVIRKSFEPDYNNASGHKGGTKKGLNLVDANGNRNSPGTDPEGNSVTMQYVNVHNGASANGNYNSRGSAGCITVNPDNTGDFFDTFYWTSPNTYTGNSTGIIRVVRVDEVGRKAAVDAIYREGAFNKAKNYIESENNAPEMVRFLEHSFGL